MSTPPIVIIAEPDPMIRSVLRVEFTRGDFAVFLASSGPEAEDFAAHTVAHLVVIDAKLKLGGYEACARIRHREGYAERPIVLTANEPSERIRAAASAAGATVVLAKPYSVTDLFSAIRPFLQPDDLLFTHRAEPSGVRASQEWIRGGNPTWHAGDKSALTRNGLLMPIVRGKGVSIPLIRKP
jgi:twitching motility two-component system response regulator PilG